MTALSALQTCLAAEHAAVYGYGVVGGVLAGTPSAADQGLARTAYDAHVDRRNALRTRIESLGESPAAALPAYALPFEVFGVAAARRLAVHLEQRTAAVYAAAVAETVTGLRELTAGALLDCAVRAAAWGAPDDVLPGLDER